MPERTISINLDEYSRDFVITLAHAFSAEIDRWAEASQSVDSQDYIAGMTELQTSFAQICIWLDAWWPACGEAYVNRSVKWPKYWDHKLDSKIHELLSAER